MQDTPSKRYQQLQPEERMTITSLLHQQYSNTQIATRLKRSTSTSRESTSATAKTGATPAKKLYAEGIFLVWCIIFEGALVA